MNHEEWISERAMSAAVVSISSMFLLLFKLLLCQTWCVFCSISHQMFDISEEELDLVLGEICSNSDTNDIDLLGGTVASVFVLNWYIDIVNILVIQFTWQTLGLHSLNNFTDTQSTLNWHSVNNWASMHQLMHVYSTTLDDVSMKISWPSAGSRPRCWSCDDLVSMEMSIECWSKCHSGVN